MSQPIEAQSTLKVVMGDDFADDGELVTIPEKDGTINVAWNIYEFAALQIPLRHVHPECEAVEDAPEEEKTDPRWDELKKILHKQ